MSTVCLIIIITDHCRRTCDRCLEQSETTAEQGMIHQTGNRVAKVFVKTRHNVIPISQIRNSKKEWARRSEAHIASKAQTSYWYHYESQRAGGRIDVLCRLCTANIYFYLCKNAAAFSDIPILSTVFVAVSIVNFITPTETNGTTERTNERQAAAPISTKWLVTVAALCCWTDLCLHWTKKWGSSNVYR